MNRKLLSFLFVVAVIFTVAIITGPDRQGENRSLIDSLRIRAYNAERGEQKWKDRAGRDSILANTWFLEAEKWRKSKTVYVTKYKNDTAKINHLSDPKLDSAIQSVYPRR